MPAFPLLRPWMQGHAGLGSTGSGEESAPLVVFLCTDEAANINGCCFGTGRKISLYPEPKPVRAIYKDGKWTVDELVALVPATVAQGLVNPSPPTPPKEG